MKQQAQALFFVYLILSCDVLHAARIQQGVAEHTQGGKAAENMELSQISKAATNGVGCGFFNFIGFGGGKKAYHFEAAIFNDGVGMPPAYHEFENVAIELDRDPEAPKLIVHKGKTWTAEYQTNGKLRLEKRSWVLWGLAEVPDIPQEKYTLPAAMIKSVEELEPKEQNGEKGIAITGIAEETGELKTLQFYGGVFFFEPSLKKMLKDLKEKDNMKEEWNKYVNLKHDVAKEMSRKKADTFESVVVAGGVSLGAPIGAVALTGFVVASLVGGEPVAFLVAVALVAGGSAGFVGGAVVGALVGSALGVATAKHTYEKIRREMVKSASQKLYEKLTCIDIEGNTEKEDDDASP